MADPHLHLETECSQMFGPCQYNEDATLVPLIEIRYDTIVEGTLLSKRHLADLIKVQYLFDSFYRPYLLPIELSL